LLLGSHPSVAGGLDRAFGRAAEVSAVALQIFTKTSGQWREPELSRAEVAAFRAAREGAGGPPVLSHASYLVNLCADRDDVLARSREALARELERCDALGVDAIALHPGAAMALAPDVALDLVAESLGVVLARTKGVSTRLCIENTAGQGTCLGHTLDELAEIVRRTPGGERLGLVLDTQHLFASGQDLREAAAYDAYFAALEARLGPGRLVGFHLNDSKKPLGSRVDRHEEIGKGLIGLPLFHRLVNDPRFADLPGILELSPDVARANLELLRSLVGAPPPPPPAEDPVPPAPARRKKRATG
jgi:deoxyribonuclease-4